MAPAEPYPGSPEPEIRRVSTPFGEIESYVGDPITQQLERFGAHQRGELAMLRGRLRPGDRVLDVGAHIGTFAVPLARWIGPGGRLDAFEGEKRHFHLLRNNLGRNPGLGRAVAHHLLVGKGGGRYVSCSAQGNTAETWFEVGSEDGEGGIRTVTLDAWWREQAARAPIHLLKIDVEGMEPDVLAGAEELLEVCRPLLYLEVHPRHLARRGLGPEAIESPLRALGYHFFRNLARRNTSRDAYVLGRLTGLHATGRFFDALAIPAGSDRYPRVAVPAPLSSLWITLRPWLGRWIRRARKRQAGPSYLW